MVLGSGAEGELHALKRISFGTHLTTKLVLPPGAVSKSGEVGGWEIESCSGLNRLHVMVIAFAYV